MCGRYVASRPVEDLVSIFEVEDVEVPEELTAPRWNVAPQAGVLAVRTRQRKPEEGDEAAPAPRRGLTDFRWGLVPSWAKDIGVGARSINARAETVIEKPAFRKALATRRCIVPADAFYEWKRTPAGREPWCFVSPAGDVLAFAGLYEVWRPASPDDRDDGPGWHGDWLLTCTIVTTDANDVVAPIHDRMPVILDRKDWAAWLDPSSDDTEGVIALLRPPSDNTLERYAVSTAVNYADSEGPELVKPIDRTEQPSLFG